MELDRIGLYFLVCEGLGTLGALLCAASGKWEIAACGWGVACYCAINRKGKASE